MPFDIDIRYLGNRFKRLRKFGWWLPDQNAIATYRSIWLYYFVIIIIWEKED